MTILLLSGSPSTPSRSSRLLHFVGNKLSELGHDVSHISLRDLPAQALLHADFKNTELAAIRQQIAEADAVVVATPVYKAAYSGLLKLFLDMLPQDGLKDKLVLPIATGGSQSHMLALDYALRPVLAALDARHILPSVYATDAQIEWSEQDGLRIDPAIEKRLHNGIHHLNEGLALSEFNRLKSASVPSVSVTLPVDVTSVSLSQAAEKVPCTA
ncbi:NADPH-dependent FMN reductase [Undibacterium sp. RTI2.1]|uniref:NADPH-dependent FMN reductase n=1 Tax=unclassified Undibacterium TaxID=2630295 RepID=UPI002AB5D16F|nr:MULTISPECIES: NADPH-dependent FMN reductase [unclassified Undibacterium]MDY7539087.1 NADPH-dependent FMN reductase [Undibacterium sp. 5I1]MEB0030988.1 NADPH-dependent FMN reductase [Undibacterium sp. RTI2.1]MEB0115835.1 NADPH-dependent FMN reductase [Undibacterium sp. RTI2.2]MEB0229779.1 NADPH-dependent FMN reductase [Undibacterium sp. 10I3]MEB0258316.1 NADPH-dependent FMN reductase [Undibacterium sp. 5I1]